MDRVGKARLKSLGMNYSQYLSSSHWDRFRAAYVISRPKVCLVCRAKKVQFHHLTYERLGHERSSDIVLLCPKHHRALHNIQKARRRRFLTPESIRAVLTGQSPRRPPRPRRRP